MLGRYVVNTVALMAGTACLTIVVGVACAWLVTVYRFPGSRLLAWALVLPLAIPTYIAAFAYAGLVDFSGPIQSALRPHLGAEAAAAWTPDVMHLPGAILVIACVLYPYVYVVFRGSLLGQCATLLEVSQDLGRGRGETLFAVVLPLARPAIAGGVALVLMETLNDYGAVHYYGIDTFTTAIFRAWLSLGDVSAAVRLSACLMVLVAVVIFLERWHRGRARFAESGGRPFRPTHLTGWRGLAASALCGAPVLFGFGIPVAMLVRWGWTGAEHFVDPDFLWLVARTFLLAVGAAGLVVAAAVLTTYAVRLRRSGFLAILARVVGVGYAIPGAIIAIGVMVSLVWLDRRLNAAFATRGLLLSGSVVALVYAYLVRFLAVGLQPVEAGFARQPEDLDRAARSLGHRPWGVLWKVHLPLIRGALAGAAILVFIDVLKELPLTLILRPFDFDTLATRTYELASEERLAEAATGALVIVATSVLPLVVLNRLMDGRRT